MDIKQEPVDYNFPYVITTNLHEQSSGERNEANNLLIKQEIVANIHENKDYNLMAVKPEELYIREEKLSIDDNVDVQTKVGSDEKMFECDICGKRYNSRGSLISHVKIHSAEKQFTCNMCEYKTVYNHSLKNHMKTHFGEKSLACSICEFRTAHKQSLECHMKAHTGEKPYACNTCQYRTARKEHLRVHMKTHTGEKPFACGSCAFLSAHKGHLKRHMKVHTVEKPCSIWKFLRTSKRKLAQHMKDNPGENFSDYLRKSS